MMIYKHYFPNSQIVQTTLKNCLVPKVFYTSLLIHHIISCFDAIFLETFIKLSGWIE